MELIFSFDHDCAQEAEFSDAQDLCNIINSYINSSINEKPYLLLINPKSGVQKGLKIYQNCIIEMFEKHKVKYVVMMTEHSLHAFNFIKSCKNLSDYRGLVMVSGDGLVYEIFTGLMERISWREDLLSIPIGVIAAGSGNGLAATICAFSGICPNVNLTLQNILILKNPFIRPLDLMKLQTSNGKELPAFLSFTWGLIANIDVGSDKFRWMGTTRFNLAAAIQIAKLNKFKAKLWYLPCQSLDCDDNLYQNQSETNNTNLLNTSDQSFKYLKDINIPIQNDKDWIHLDDRFIGVVATLLPYLASNACVAPSAKINDGKIHLIIMLATISRSELLSFISKLESGQHINSKSVTFIECKAFRLVPECDKCLMAVDGEYLSPCSVQGEIMPSVARVFTGLDAEGQLFI